MGDFSTSSLAAKCTSTINKAFTSVRRIVLEFRSLVVEEINPSGNPFLENF